MIAERQEIEKFLGNHFLFKQMDKSTIETIALECGVLSVKPNKEICTMGGIAKSFFIMLSGSAKKHENFGRQSVLTSGDCFGHEALARKTSHYRQTITTTEQCVVLLFEPAKFQGLINSNPDLKKLLRLQAGTASINHSKNLPWLNPGEDIKYITRRHVYDLYRKLASPLTLFLIALVVSLVLFAVSSTLKSSIWTWFGMVAGLLALWSFWLILDWRNDYYVLTNQRVVLLERKYLFYETRHVTPLEAIQTIGISSELLGRLLAYGSVSVKTYTGTVNLSNLEAPALVVDTLDYYISKQKTEINGIAIKEYEKKLQERLSQSGEVPPKQVSSVVQMFEPVASQTGRKLFALKEITPEGVIYRTHWFILIKKTALPLLFFCLGIALLIFYIQGRPGFFTKDLLLVSAILFSLIGFLALLYQFVDWRNDQYIITRDQIIDINRKPLGHEEKRAAPLRNIQTIEYKRKGIFGLLFNFGTVFIRIGDTDLTFDYVHNPAQVQQELFAHFMQITQQDKQSELQAESNRMVEWIKAYHHITKTTEERPQKDKNG